MPNSNARILRVILWFFIIILFIQAAFVLHYKTSPVPHPLTYWEYAQKGRDLIDQKEYKKAEDFLNKSLALNPHYYKAQWWMGLSYLRKGEYIYARKWLEQALKNIGDNRINDEIIYYDLGLTYISEHEADNAWFYLREAFSMKNLMGTKYWPPDDTPDPFHDVMINNRKQFDVLIKDYSPPGIWYRDTLFDEWYKYHQAKKILKDCQGYLDRNPGSFYTEYIVRWQATASLQLNDYDKSLDYLDSLNKYKVEEKDKAWALQERYTIYYYRKEYLKSLFVLQDLLRNYTKYNSIPWCKSQIADVYNKMGDIKNEKRIYQEIVEDYSDSKEAYKAQTRLVEILAAQGNYIQAFQYLKGMFTFRKGLEAIGGVFLGCGIFLFLFFVFSRIFYVRLLESIKQSRFRLLHLWVIASLVTILGMYASYLFFQLNEITGNLLGGLTLNPLLAGMIVVHVVTVFVCVKWLAVNNGWDRQKIGLYPKGIMVDLGLSLLTASGLIIVGGLWMTFLLKAFGVHAAPVHPMDHFIQDEFVNPFILPKILTVIALVLTGPICEEVFFRVFLFNFLKVYSNAFWAVVFSALCFSVGHEMPLMIPYYFLTAVVLNILYIRTGSIYPSIITHALLNFLCIFFMAS